MKTILNLQRKNKSFSLVIFIAILVMAGSFVFDRVEEVGADTVTPSVTVGNSAPSMSSITLDDATIDATTISLSENNTRTVTATGTATDANTDSDISSATATIYKSDVALAANCAADNNTCYRITSGNCTITAGAADNDATVACVASVQFHATPSDSDSTIWTAKITVKDTAGLTGSATNSTETIEVATLNALAVTSSFTYTGPLAPSATSSASETTTATTTGNAEIDVQISGSGMKSGATGMTTSSERYSMTNQNYQDMSWSMSDTPTCRELTSSGKPTTSSSDKVDTVYWRIGIPGGQATGSYSSTTTVDAVVSSTC